MSVYCFSYTWKYFQDLWTWGLMWRKKDYLWFTFKSFTSFHLWERNISQRNRYEVFIRLIKCAHSMHLKRCTISKMFRGKPTDSALTGGEGCGEGDERRRGEGHRCNHHWDWGDVGPPIFWCSGTSNFEPPTFGIHQNSKMPVNSLRLKMNHNFITWALLPKLISYQLLNASITYHAFNNQQTGKPSYPHSLLSLESNLSICSSFYVTLARPLLLFS